MIIQLHFYHQFVISPSEAKTTTKMMRNFAICQWEIYCFTNCPGYKMWRKHIFCGEKRNFLVFGIIWLKKIECFYQNWPKIERKMQRKFWNISKNPKKLVWMMRIESTTNIKRRQIWSRQKVEKPQWVFVKEKSLTLKKLMKITKIISVIFQLKIIHIRFECEWLKREIAFEFIVKRNGVLVGEVC